MGKTALITGVTGQDGSYLAEFLLEKGYEVHGIKRRASLFNTARVDHIYQDPHKPGNKFKLHYGDLSDSTNIIRIVQEVRPDEIYNLGAQSHVKVSFECPEYTAEVDGVGTLRLLEAMRIVGIEKSSRFYQASTSELYGLVQEVPQTEKTPFHPRSPYACAKLYAYWICVNYRESYGMFTCNGILFNHESPRRGETFVTRKITRGLANIALGIDDCLHMGNLDSLRDWGHAKDYVEMQWLILQRDVPDDYVIATGRQHSVRDFIRMSAARLGITLRFEGAGVDERAVVDSVDAALFQASCARLAKAVGGLGAVFGQALDEICASYKRLPGKTIIRIDPKYFRPAEVETLLGNPAKAKEKLGWTPRTTIDEMVAEMVQNDLEHAMRHFILERCGFEISVSQE